MMRVIETGHIYDMENKESGVQRITFFKDLPFTSAGHDGVLCQEVLRVLINRVLELWKQKPCLETTEIVTKLRECLILFESRAARTTIEKCFSKIGLNVEELQTHENGHVFDLTLPLTEKL